MVQAARPGTVPSVSRLPLAGHRRGTAWFAAGSVLAEDVVEVTDDPRVLDAGGWWAIVADFESPPSGALRLWRFAGVRRAPRPGPPAPWAGPARGDWVTSMSRSAYLDGVSEIRRRIREGEVYQVNLCRVLQAPVRSDADPWSLAGLLAKGNPAPYAAVVDVPAADGDPGVRVVSASPELFLRRDGDVVQSCPIKGTGMVPADLRGKDEAENVMIVDLVRNDLQHVCRPGTVEVPALLQVERHPGLVHLVSTVRGRLRQGAGWADLLAATMPPGSVSGAPKSSALHTIADLEPTPRGPYCGALGWVDADRRRACLAVGIRTFWWAGAVLRFGTGAGITWGSDPEREWEETELKARRLVGLASTDDRTGTR
jgi:para-aminobenzoate synthetase component 1